MKKNTTRQKDGEIHVAQTGICFIYNITVNDITIEYTLETDGLHYFDNENDWIIIDIFREDEHIHSQKLYTELNETTAHRAMCEYLMNAHKSKYNEKEQ